MMKSILSSVALCAAIALVGCSSSSKTASPGAVGENKCCAEGKSAECCKSKSGTAASPGAVSDKPACSKTCPMTGKTTGTSEASPGAVSDAKPGCCKSKAASSSCGGAAKVDG